MNSQATILSTIPLVLVLTALSAAIIFSPQNQDIRNRAASQLPAIPTTSPTSNPTPQTTPSPTPEIGCSSLYQPVCGKDQKTYPNPCSAKKESISIASYTSCSTSLPLAQ